MVNRGLLLEKLIAIGVLKKSGRISPKYNEILCCEPIFLQHIIEYTKNLRYSADVKARIHCLLLGITEQPYCSCGAVLKMRMTGRFVHTFPTHCSNKCTSNDTSVIEKRKGTNLARYGATTPLLKTDISG